MKQYPPFTPFIFPCLPQALTKAQDTVLLNLYVEPLYSFQKLLSSFAKWLFKGVITQIHCLRVARMKIDPLLQKELQERFNKDNRSVLFVTRTKMFVHLSEDQWQQNCSGLLVVYQKRYTYGFTIMSTLDLDINFDFELYSNFPTYTKYIGDLKCLVFLAPSQNNILKLMLVLQTKTELQELKKHIDKIYSVGSSNLDVDFLNQPDVQEIIRKVPIDQNLLAKDKLFREGVEDQLNSYFKKISNKDENKVNSGFKSYAVGREERQISEQQKLFLRSRYENEILELLSKLQKQAKIRNLAK